MKLTLVVVMPVRRYRTPDRRVGAVEPLRVGVETIDIHRALVNLSKRAGYECVHKGTHRAVDEVLALVRIVVGQRDSDVTALVRVLESLKVSTSCSALAVLVVDLHRYAKHQ